MTNIERIIADLQNDSHTDLVRQPTVNVRPLETMISIIVPFAERFETINRLMATGKISSIKVKAGELRGSRTNGLSEPVDGLATLELQFNQ